MIYGTQDANLPLQDSEHTSQTVHVDRLYHRQLLARLNDISELETKYNCKIHFPSTEEASDEVKVDGPQWQVPHCADELLVRLFCFQSGR